jgi:hypothetical protein
MEATKKIVINNQEYDLPEGIEPLGEEGLYMVDWNLIEIAKEVGKGTEEKEFHFFNPRHLGQYEMNKDGDKVEVCFGQGFGKDEMRDLMTDLVQNGVAYPLQAYFFALEDGKLKVRVHDGERRYRCLERMIDKDMKVWSRLQKQFAPAKEVYSQVLCRVEIMTEEEAFIRACAISETSVKWGDGANARLVKMLYAKGKSDEEICKMLNKSKPWLAETCTLNELDDYCFNFLLAGNLNRKGALDLAKVKDIKARQTWLAAAWKDALEQHAIAETKKTKLLEKAEANQELADAEVEEAKGKGETPEVVAALEVAAESAAEKTQKRKTIKAASARPVVKSRNLQRAGGVLNALRAPKIKKIVGQVEEMIEKKDNSVVDLKILEVLKVAYQCILDGEEDVNNVLKKLVG